MSSVSLSVVILRPVGDVFAVLTDVGSAARWSSALEEDLITPGRRLAMRGVAGFPFPVRILAELEPADGGALLRWTTWLEPGGIASRSARCSPRATGGRSPRTWRG
jgi:hypothetical protein